MKKTITLFFISIFCLMISSYAQINKGSIMIGGTVNGYSSNYKNADSSISKQSQVAISPSIGFAVAKNTIVGISFLYYSLHEKEANYSFQPSSQDYGAALFARKYKELFKNFYLFGEGDLSYTYNKYNYSTYYLNDLEYNSNKNTIALSFTPGIAYSLTSAIQLEAGLQNLLYFDYSNSTENPKDGSSEFYDKQTGFNLSSSLNPISFSGISFGVRFLFNKSSHQ